jgi:hypothetical protein
MNRTEAVKELSKELCKELTKILDTQLRSCINCIQFNGQDELCCKFKARPPATVIARGCPDWDYNDTPL